MAIPKVIRQMAGTRRVLGPVQVPVNTQDLAAAVEQLQATVNEMIVNFNAHTHGGVTAGAASTGVTATAQLITGGGETAADLFTTAPTS